MQEQTTEEIISRIYTIDKAICKNIEKFKDNERGILSQNILSQLRNFVEIIFLKVYSEDSDIDITYENIKKANEYIKARGDLKFLKSFHRFLQITVSHYTLDEENSERLMLKYYEYLIKIKSYLKSNYNIEVLGNLNSFPINTDSNLKEYYDKIAKKINSLQTTRTKVTYNDRYYIQKVKPFFINDNIYYEVTFTRAHDYVSKFDRIIAFTKKEITHSYAVKLSVSKDFITILGKKMPIQIIDNWEVSIRPCELNNFASIFGKHKNLGNTIEYLELMKYLTNGINLVELTNLKEEYYEQIKKNVLKKAKSSNIFKLLEKCRKLNLNQSPGYNIITYLLYSLNNKIIKKQFNSNSCPLLSNLRLEFGCIPFDQMPFNSSLKNHNPKLIDLLNSVDISNRKHELLARLIKNNTLQKGQLYTPKNELENFEKINKLKEKWNDSIYWKHERRKIGTYKKHFYIEGYEEDVVYIINKLKKLTTKGIGNYSNSVDSWLQSEGYIIDCEEKKNSLIEMFEQSNVAFIYGAAGTGKTTMINHISNFFNSDNKLFLANTNPAVNNLERRVKASNCTFKTITKLLWSNQTECDILIIDECSTVSNTDFRKVLNKITFRLLILVGDVFQIESILFGNWFNLAKSFVPKTSVFELTKPYRSNNPKLIDLWNRVRNIDETILEHMTKNQYTTTLNESIFEHTEKDEIILCLNYDGLYGINNINTFLQGSNTNPPTVWGTHTYKVNDPIIFNEADRFSPILYNNLKGRIVKIKKDKDKIQFDLEINKVINEFETYSYDFELLENNYDNKSTIRFSVDKFDSTDEDDDSSSNTVIPFQVAYAVSIHKAQGLEYNSVKIVITNEVEERISHNIFYTAITRAKEKLKIYWTPETENKVLNSLEHKFNSRDFSLIKSKHNL
ncbi:ATP-dependent DNA helicase [Tenacibaculum aiptasiae]|uniref:ATP-dependent DNA helicase n=1 Tax=Tenacibaculum aiptasiae TaxID=426481 RepID=UPI003B5A2E09